MTLLFPCFGIDFFGDEDNIIKDYGIDIEEYFKIAEKYLSIESFLIKQGANEFLEQVKIFVYSAAISDILKIKKIVPTYLAYYSMGIYAALYFSQAIDFETALFLIKKVHEISLSHIVEQKNDYKIAYVIGLAFKDILNLINANKFQIEIINQNNEYSFVVTGIEKDVYLFIDRAQKEGALKANLIKNSKIPFHSNYIYGAISLLKKMLEEVNVSDSAISLISSVNQKIFSTKEEIKNEILNNIVSYMNWNSTFCKLLHLGEKIFIETGPGQSLSKVARFIPGDFKIYTLKDIKKVVIA